MRITSRYKSKTPFTVELVSDILFIISQATTGYAVFADNIILAWISLVSGTLAKILVRFIEEKNAQEGLDDSNTDTSSISTGNESTE